MNKNIKFTLFLSLCVFLVCICTQVFAGRETISNPPQQINMLSGDTPWAFRIVNDREPGGVLVYEIKPDGSISIHNSSGVTVWGVDNAGKPIIGQKARYAFVDMDHLGTAGNTKYSMTSAYDRYIFDMHRSYGALNNASNSGASVYLPAGSAALDGYMVTVSLFSTDSTTQTSGTSDIYFVPANDSVLGSGITDYLWAPSPFATGGMGTATGATVATNSSQAFLYNIVDQPGEWATFMYRYAVAGGTWYLVSGSSPYGN